MKIYQKQLRHSGSQSSLSGLKTSSDTATPNNSGKTKNLIDQRSGVAMLQKKSQSRLGWQRPQSKQIEFNDQNLQETKNNGNTIKFENRRKPYQKPTSQSEMSSIKTIKQNHNNQRNNQDYKQENKDQIDSFNFVDLEVDINEEIQDSGNIHKAVLLKTNQYSFANKKGISTVDDQGFSMKMKNQENKTKKLQIEDGEENLDESEDYKSEQQNKKLNNYSTYNFKTKKVAYETFQSNKNDHNLSTASQLLEYSSAKRDKSNITRQKVLDSSIRTPITQTIVRSIANTHYHTPKRLSINTSKPKSPITLQKYASAANLHKLKLKQVTNQSPQLFKTRLDRSPGQYVNASDVFFRQEARSQLRYDSLKRLMKNVIETPDYYSNLNNLVNQVPLQNEPTEQEKHQQSQERNKWNEKYSSLTIQNYADNLNIPYGTIACEQVELNQFSSHRIASNSRERFWRDQMATNINGLSSLKLIDNEDIEYETYLKLRKHFDQKNQSKVDLSYSEQKEKLENYQSRFKSLNQTNVLSQKIMLYYNSKVF